MIWFLVAVTTLVDGTEQRQIIGEFSSPKACVYGAAMVAPVMPAAQLRCEPGFQA